MGGVLILGGGCFWGFLCFNGCMIVFVMCGVWCGLLGLLFGDCGLLMFWFDGDVV